MRTVRLGVTILAVAALVPLTASAASAAPPANDRPPGAIALSLGDTVAEDTSQATTGTLDAKVNEFCGAPFTNASVWYTYTPSAAGGAIFDTTGSDYEAGIMVFRGNPSPGDLRTCGPISVGLRVRAGQTYTVMVFSDNEVNGGNLQLSLQPAPPPPDVTVTIDPTGKAFDDGTAQVSGTYMCSNADFLDIEGTLTQIWKRVKITGYFSSFRQNCDGAEHPWKRVVSSDNGLYAKGTASVVVDGFACGLLQCSDSNSKGDVTLVPGGRHAPAGQSPSGTSCASSRSVPLYDRSQACRMGARSTA